VDAKHIAHVSCGRLPLRAPRVDPGFPTVGTGDHDWRGFLAPGAHPHAIDPQGGVILNWNNKPAPGLAASDDTWTYGAGHRSLLLSRGIPATGRVSLLDAVRDMNRAATSDLRGVEVGAERLVAARPRRRRDDRRPGRRDPRRGMAEARGRGARAGARLLRER
jgi:acyl-homoserine lactone acylase PvdQ